MQQVEPAPLSLRDRARQDKASRRFTIGLVVFVLLLVVGGAVYAITDSASSAPALPPPPPRAQKLWESQTTEQLGANQIVSVALYRVSMTPAATIAYFRRAIAHHGGDIGRFNIVIRRADEGSLPIALPQLPRDFATGTGRSAHANYTFTEYTKNDSKDDIGIAVDLRHPKGPTLVFFDMLSS